MLAVGAACVLLFACTDAGRADDQDYQNFLTLAKRAPAEGYTMYWLGRQLEGGGLTFTGPSVSDFGLEDPGSINMSYDAPVLAGRGGVSFDLLLYSPAAWQAFEATGGPRLATSLPTKTVTVAGHSATLTEFDRRVFNGAPAGLELQADLGGTMLRVRATRAGSPTPGAAQLNPLIDEATFLAVLQGLRPYPD